MRLPTSDFRHKFTTFVRLGLPATLAFLSACGASPEKALVGCWKEIDARYEKLPKDGRVNSQWSDGVRVRDYPARAIVRHEAEAWEFRPEGLLDILGKDGKTTQGRWRLKGRGHVMTVRFPVSQGFEVYDIKELNEDQMVLHFDSGMEVKGVARLEFKRQTASANTCASLKEMAKHAPPKRSANSLGDAS